MNENVLKPQRERAMRAFVVRARGARSKRSRRAGRGVALERAALLSLLALGSTGCGGDDDDPRARAIKDIGDICVDADADGRLTFSVSIEAQEHCLTSCNTNTTTCRAMLTDHRIELRSLLEIRPQLDICDAACHGSMGSCQLEAPAPGDYEFGFASRLATATLPLEGSIALFGDHTCGPTGSPLPPDSFR